MKRMLTTIAVVVTMFSLTSCISYTSSKIKPSQSSTIMPSVQKKAYIEELTMSSDADIWIRNSKQRKAGVKIGPPSEKDFNNDLEHSLNQGSASQQASSSRRFLASSEDYDEIAKYISSSHPEIFTLQKDEGIPVKIKIDGKSILIKQSIFDEIFNRLIFLGIFPFGCYGEEAIDILVETLEAPSKKESYNCTLIATYKTGICVSPFAWIGAAFAKAAHFDGGNVDIIWQNHFLTPEFADSVAVAVRKLIDK